MLLTSNDTRTARAAVDNQPTSYEQNKQFKIFHRFIDVLGSDQIVFKFEAGTAAANIKTRRINLWEGSREYLVIKDEGQYPAVDAALSAIDITSVNSNLEDSGLSVHPTPAATVSYAVISGDDLIDIADTDQFPNGDVVKTDSNNNRSNNIPSTDPNLVGFGAGASFYLVMRTIGNGATSGHFFLLWEER